MSVNKVILLGHVGKDPDVKYFDNGNAVANFTLATTERGYTAANRTNVPDKTTWHTIIAWKGLAKIVEQYVKKGSQLYVEGKIEQRSYDDKDGKKRYVTEIIANNITLLGRPNNSADPMANVSANDFQNPQDGLFPDAPQANRGNQVMPDDDLPF